MENITTDEIQTTFGPVFEAEKAYIGIKPDEKTYGLAFSGGGIRSASFGLGVMQALVNRRKLEKMHYLSTVSGGGYLGAALTWALNRGGDDVSTTPEKFPLGDKEAHTGRSTNKTGNDLLNYIRQHSKYLTPTGPLDIISFVAVVVRSMFMSLLVYVSLITAVMCIFYSCNAFGTTAISELFGMPHTYFGGKGIFIPLAVLMAVFYVLLNLWYSLQTFFGLEKITGSFQKYLDFLQVQVIIGIIWKAIIPLLLIGSIPFLVDQIESFQESMIASGTTFFGFAVSIWQFIKAQKKDKSTGPISDSVIYLGAFSLIYGLLLISYMFGVKGATVFHPVLFIAVLLLIAVVFGVFVNLNLISPSRIWRNRLMEAFMPDRIAVDVNKWKPAQSADNALMEDMCAAPHQRPYHLVNTNIILADSENVAYNGRGGDNFIISRLFCGSDATGWRATKDTHELSARRISLATAMATSAAAVNPNAGVSGEGATRNTMVSIMFSILNIRLGYWTTNPSKKAWKLPPNFFMPGMTSEIIRAGLNETSRNIQLSDGGHFENLAIYELIRRKTDVIILSDGGADPLFNFDDLSNAIEKVRVDFGTNIWFREGYSLSELLPGTLDNTAYDKKYATAKQGYAVADIDYGSGKKGVLFYIKLTMVKDLPVDVYSYKGVHPEFPHESTADQFFDEKQFEAYRELGYNICKELTRESNPHQQEAFG